MKEQFARAKARRRKVILLLADVNIQGHIDIMVRRMQADPSLLEFWNHLELSCVSFAIWASWRPISDSVVGSAARRKEPFFLRTIATMKVQSH